MGRRDVNRGHAKTKETECIRGFGEPDGKTGGNDGVGCVGEVICIYPPSRMNGVRELRRTVESLIQIPLNNLILSGELSKHPSWQVVCSDKGLSIVPI